MAGGGPRRHPALEFSDDVVVTDFRGLPGDVVYVLVGVAHDDQRIGTIEFDLDELDLSKPAGGGGHIASGDEIGTKLDLARVYADMGDNEAARGLLNEVLGTGNAAQKGEAEGLLKRLSA